MRNTTFILLAVLSAGLFSCDTNRVYEDFHAIPKSGWEENKTHSFEFEVQDTLSLYNMMVNVRNTNDFPYSNCYLFVEMTSPSEKIFVDTLEIRMADKTGRWLGSGVGNNWQIRKILVRDVKLLESGTYHVRVQHGMRDALLIGLSDVGFRLEYAE